MSTLRNSALWGKKEGGDSRTRPGRSSRGFRRAALCLAACAAFVLPGVASAGDSQPLPSGPFSAQVPPSLLAAARANPNGSLGVIVQGDGSAPSTTLDDEIVKALGLKGAAARSFLNAVADFQTISGVATNLTGRQLLSLAMVAHILSITPDTGVTAQANYDNAQNWDDAVAAKWYFGSPFYAQAPKAATIAVVDSGIDNSNGVFGNRILASVDMGGGFPSGDGRGHGTFVAALAAGAGDHAAGAAATAPIVSLDVFDAQGHAQTSDVIRAADWILEHKNQYGIRVANFSLQADTPSSFTFDPLDKAVERLWQAGIVVVAAAGNYAESGSPSGVYFAPANDPFVLTVGAVDVHGSPSTTDDFNAPWSAYGYTPDGFAKPEVAAPGRYMIAAVPTSSTILAAYPNNILGPGLIELSGTSFAAPVVSGLAADLLGVHPDWTPDQVKGALMVAAQPLKNAAPMSVGVGEVNLQRILDGGKRVVSPPNPNAALEQFLVPDASGGSLPVFDAASWSSAASSNASWSSASWSSASWSSASWSSASWSSASWSSASWSSASWSSASWSSASWSSASWSSVARPNNAAADGLGDG